ncbi:MAG: hypothetical protein WC810_27235 [Janthinobacterium sp.]|jgi:hypothetical protein
MKTIVIQKNIYKIIEEVEEYALWEPKNISLITGGDNTETGHEFRKKLISRKSPLPGVEILKFLHENQQMIPKDWDDGLETPIFFLGTIVDLEDGPAVTCLQMGYGNWHVGGTLLEYVWGEGSGRIALWKE